MKTAVEAFEAILSATLELATSMEKAHMSTMKLLQKALARNPNPLGIDAFVRMAEAIGRGLSVLQREGKAPTRKAHAEMEKQELLARAVKTPPVQKKGHKKSKPTKKQTPDQ